MQLNFHTYIPGSSIIHQSDARVKLILLLAYSITLFMVRTWTGILLCAVICVVANTIAQIPLRRIFGLLVPLFVILLLTILFNAFSFDIATAGTPYGMGNVSAGVFATWEPVPMIGDFGFVPAGFARGCFYALRIILLVVASLIVSFTTTSTELIDALYDFLRPLRVFHVPTEDIAMMLSIALRFIPLTAEEFSRIQAAQQSRGVTFDEGGLVKRIRAWQPVLIPMFVGLFRRADNLALAMETRCYAMVPTRSRLHPRAFSGKSAVTLVVGLLACVVLSLVF